ncbi:MAG: hypothetical protein WKF54_07635 [Nocardioidaceae bacterium]
MWRPDLGKWIPAENVMDSIVRGDPLFDEITEADARRGRPEAFAGTDRVEDASRTESQIIHAVHEEWALEVSRNLGPMPTDVDIAPRDGETPSQFAEGEELMRATGAQSDDPDRRTRAALAEAGIPLD